MEENYEVSSCFETDPTDAQYDEMVERVFNELSNRENVVSTAGEFAFVKEGRDQYENQYKISLVHLSGVQEDGFYMKAKVQSDNSSFKREDAREIYRSLMDCVREVFDGVEEARV